MEIFAINFNWDVNLGGLVALGGVLVAMYKMHISNIRRMDSLETKVSLMWTAFKRRFRVSEQEEEDGE